MAIELKAEWIGHSGVQHFAAHNKYLFN